MAKTAREIEIDAYFLAESYHPVTAPLRARTKVFPETILEHLFVNPDSFTNDELKVWVSTGRDRHSTEWWDEFVAMMEPPTLFPLYHDILPITEAAPFRPGQYFLMFNVTTALDIRLHMSRISSVQPYFIFQGETFYLAKDRRTYHGLPIGDGRQFRSAAKRAWLSADRGDWFGGISDFAKQFLKRPRGWKPKLQ